MVSVVARRSPDVSHSSDARGERHILGRQFKRLPGGDDRTKTRLQEAARPNVLIRLIMSHVYEALKIVDQINQSDVLRAAVDQCGGRTRGKF